jgi:exo-1,4-beta-D-glucosaminidase
MKNIISSKHFKMKKFRFLIFILSGSMLLSCSQKKEAENQLILKDNWAIQSSDSVKDDGASISSVEYRTEGWFPTTAPTTVLAALVRNKLYTDPYYGTNINLLPGHITNRDRHMPDDSPFGVPWWYRTVFHVPSDFKGKNIWLHLNSINYQANIWINGKLMADTSQIEGAYRLYDLNIADYVNPGKENCLAFEIYPPEGNDLTITWVDWNPTPPDRGMGIWYDVSIQATGKVAIKYPHVVTKLNLPSTDLASLTVGADLVNAGQNGVSGILTGKIEKIEFSQPVTLAAGETKTVTFNPDQFPMLKIKNPRLWWPYNVGPQNLYDLNLTFKADSMITDSKKVTFGIREITSYMNHFGREEPTKVFQINGKSIVIRGGGYVEDMMLRPSEERIKTDIAYARQMNLNTLRMEGPRGPDYIFDLCDREGIMLMVGWCCCSSWERWKQWTPHITDIAQESLKDQVLRLRNHPSVFTWLYGSDGPPPADVENMYLDVLNTYDGTRPTESSATQDSTSVTGYSGVWMGPYPDVYAYEPPSSWYQKYQFNTEAAPAGEQISPYESLKKMMPEKDLWPISESWDLRLHPRFDSAARASLFSRYGQPMSVKEYCVKSQVLQKEAVRAMYEAFAKNKYKSSGIIYWMYNSAWPSLYWQLYDYYFTPNGAFYGAREACEPLHIQYAYDDSSIYVVNSTYNSFSNLTASAKLYNFNLEEKFSQDVSVSVIPDDSRKIIEINWPNDNSNIYFLKLELSNDADSVISRNFYWLSRKGDEKADFTDLNKLQDASVNVALESAAKSGDTWNAVVKIENISKNLAFFVNPKIIKDQSRDLVTPVFWDDNYISMLPGDKRTVSVHFDAKDLGEEQPMLEVEGWNVEPVDVVLK